MAEAKDRAEWNRTFAIISQIYNANRPPKSDGINPLDFFPWKMGEAKKPRKLTPEERQKMKTILPKKG